MRCFSKEKYRKGFWYFVYRLTLFGAGAGVGSNSFEVGVGIGVGADVRVGDHEGVVVVTSKSLCATEHVPGERHLALTSPFIAQLVLGHLLAALKGCDATVHTLIRTSPHSLLSDPSLGPAFYSQLFRLAALPAFAPTIACNQQHN